MTTTTTRRVTHAETLEALRRAEDRYGEAIRVEAPEDMCAAVADALRAEVAAWNTLDIHAATGPIGSLLIIAMASARQHTMSEVRSYVTTATNYAARRYAGDARTAGVTHGEPA